MLIFKRKNRHESPSPSCFSLVPLAYFGGGGGGRAPKAPAAPAPLPVAQGNAPQRARSEIGAAQRKKAGIQSTILAGTPGQRTILGSPII
jgi:hypothetical protein